MQADVSLLRWIGIGLGISMVVVGVLWGRRRRRGGASPALTLFLGIALASVGIFPGVVRIPSEVLFIESIRGGGILTLLILSSILLWLAVVWNRSKVEFLRDRLNDFLHATAVETFLAQVGSSPDVSAPVWIVIPALDEADNIAGVLSQMPATALGHELQVIVVDDGSRDQTGEVARGQGAFVIRMPMNSGQGSALKAGYEAAVRLGARAVVTLDADGQNLPSEIERVLEPILSGEADVVIGSRILGHFERTAMVRTVGVYAFNWLLSLLTGTKITDCASSFRAISSRVLSVAELKQEQYQSTEILIEAARHGYTIAETPITWRRRQSGTTKKGHSLRYGFLFLRTILKTWLR